MSQRAGPKALTLIPPVRFSSTGRLLALLFSLPAVFALRRPLPVVISFGAVLLFSVFLRPPRSIWASLQTFVWLTPALVFANALFGPPPRSLGIFSTGGALLGGLLAYRLLWGTVMAFLLIRTCPAADFFPVFLGVVKPIFPRRASSVARTVFLTVELIPEFASLRVKELRFLPGALAERLNRAEDRLKERVVAPERTAGLSRRLTPADLMLIIPAGSVSAIAILL